MKCGFAPKIIRQLPLRPNNISMKEMKEGRKEGKKRRKRKREIVGVRQWMSLYHYVYELCCVLLMSISHNMVKKIKD